VMQELNVQFSLAAVLAALLTGCATDEAVRDVRGSSSPAELAAEAEADGAFKEHVAGRNVTGEFRERFQHLGLYLTEAHKSALKHYDVLLVHGLLGEVGLKVSDILNELDGNQHLVDYLQDQLKAFEELELTVRVADHKTQAVDASGTKIAKMVLESERQVLIVSHSKGCVDTLDALLKLDRDGNLSRVAGWISIQGPFYGSPEADACVGNDWRCLYSRIALNCLGGKFAAIRDLTTAAREGYQKEHQAGIERITRALPILCFASWQTKPADGKRGEAGPPGKLSSDDNLGASEKIPPRSSILPGTDYVAKAGVSHSMTVISSSLPYDRVTFTKALLVMLAERMAEQEQKGTLISLP